MDAHAILVWFDIFDWALTPEEYAAFGVGVPDGVAMTHGFVTLPDRTELAWLRQKKSQHAWRKHKKARRWARVLACIPFVRMIAIGNALGYGNCRDASDIDLVIITASRRVWIVRLLVVGLLRFFRQRPGEYARDALCPSFFLTTEVFNFEPLQLNSQLSIINYPLSIPPDPYLFFWVMQLTVLYDTGGIYDGFWRANATWVHQWLPHVQPRGAHLRFVCYSHGFRLPASSPDDSMSGSRSKHRGFRLDAFERWARRFQERRFPSEVRALANRDSRVIVNDRMVKSHTDDRRTEYRDQWLEALRI